LHDVHIANLNLFGCFDDIKWESGGAGNTARHGAAHKVGGEAVRP
jgi:hypothetical protein